MPETALRLYLLLKRKMSLDFKEGGISLWVTELTMCKTSGLPGKQPTSTLIALSESSEAEG